MRTLVALVVMLVSARAVAAPLQAPWNRIDFRGTVAKLEKRLGTKELMGSCTGGGSHIIDGICVYVASETTGLELQLRFASIDDARAFTKRWGEPFLRDNGTRWTTTSWAEFWQLDATRPVLAVLVPDGQRAVLFLQELLPLRRLLTAGAPDGLSAVIGKRSKQIAAAFGRRGASCNEDICHLSMPPTEVDNVVAFVDFHKGVARSVSFTLRCVTSCEKSSALRAFVEILGAAKFEESDLHHAEDMHRTTVTFARRRDLAITWRKGEPTEATVCIGDCGPNPS